MGARTGGGDAMRADGTEFPVMVTISQMPDREPPMFLGLVRDISGRREADQSGSFERDQRTIAEGVDDGGAIDRLRSVGIDYAQGFHFGAPQPLDV